MAFAAGIYGGGYVGGVGTGYGSASLYGMQSGFCNQMLGGYGGFGANGCGGGWGGQSAGYLSGFYLGAEIQHQQIPMYQDAIFRQCTPYAYRDCETVQCQQPGKMWDVWFDSQAGQKTTQRSPIVLDLNGNGKPDITGQNITGDGKISGEPTLFDLDPSKSSWEFKSVKRRPGSGAPGIPNGKAVYADGTEVHFDKKGHAIKDKHKHTGEAKYYDASGKQVGELSKDTGGKMMYHWGKQETKEKTEWLAKNGGDGLLVWDVDHDGQISSSKELFGEFDIDGKKKFANGYEKLAAHFDANHDGKVEGNELQGLQVWKDADADGKVDAGELQSLAQNNITSLDTRHVGPNFESTFNRTTTHQQDVWRTGVSYQDYRVPVFAGYQDQYNVNVFGGWFSAGWGSQGGGGYWG